MKKELPACPVETTLNVLIKRNYCEEMRDFYEKRITGMSGRDNFNAHQ